MTDDIPTEELPERGGPAEPSPPPPPIGNYRPVRKIGEGGFGEVWLAEQTAPVRRQVALKIIKPGMDSKQVIARFESERQALALMDHPYIARVLDAGTTDTGRPYFVMEHVRGLSITEFCDRHKLDTRRRLELFVRVCEGVQHAHQKAIIHRDIKPSNVLVAEHDGKPLPKIIDFGIAKAIAQKLTDKTMFTQLGHFVGTPEYMSPEQADATLEDIDTRSDVYSLGVVLYELLVGALPFDSHDLRKAGMDEIRRKLREDDPPRPSTRLGTLGDDSRSAASARRTDPPSLARQLRGDLDWIVMKALEKERARRYGTPSELAADLERHLVDEPVLAGPPSASYRARKFVRRHRVSVVAASVMLVGLLAGLGLATWGFVRSTRAEAEARQDEAAARQVAEFMVELFEGPDPGQARGNTITAREILDRGVERIRSGLDDQPRTRAMLMETMGRVYRVLGLYDEARPLLEGAVEIRENASDEERLELASALNELAIVHRWQGDSERSAELARRSIAIREELLGHEHPDVAQSLSTLGVALTNVDELAEAEAIHRRAAAIREATLGPEHSDLAASLHNLAIVRYYSNDYEEAERLYKRSAEIEELAHGPENHSLATSLHTLAILYQEQRRFEEAVPIEERSLEIREKVLGPDHPHVAYSLTTLGNLYRETDRAAEAEPLLRRAVAIGDQVWEPLHPEVRWMRRGLAGSLADQGKFAESEATLRRLLELSEAGADQESLPPTLNALGELYNRLRRYPESEAMYRRSLEIDERLSGPDDPYLVSALGGLANVYRDQGRHPEADLLYKRALAILDGSTSPEHPQRLGLLGDYADCLRKAGRGAEAAALE